MTEMTRRQLRIYKLKLNVNRLMDRYETEINEEKREKLAFNIKSQIFRIEQLETEERANAPETIATIEMPKKKFNVTNSNPGA